MVKGKVIIFLLKGLSYHLSEISKTYHFPVKGGTKIWITFKFMHLKCYLSFIVALHIDIIVLV